LTLARLAPSPVTETNVSPVIFAEIQTQVDFDEAHPWVAAGLSRSASYRL
jgi:hypothetical protein